MRIAKEVVCLTYRKWYPSISYASKVTRTDKDNIAKACKKVIEHTVNLEGTKLQWMFKDEFIEVYGEDISGTYTEQHKIFILTTWRKNDENIFNRKRII